MSENASKYDGGELAFESWRTSRTEAARQNDGNHLAGRRSVVDTKGEQLHHTPVAMAEEHFTRCDASNPYGGPE